MCSHVPYCIPLLSDTVLGYRFSDNVLSSCCYDTALLHCCSDVGRPFTVSLCRLQEDLEVLRQRWRIIPAPQPPARLRLQQAAVVAAGDDAGSGAVAETSHQTPLQQS
jgi:hypothetical protein